MNDTDGQVLTSEMIRKAILNLRDDIGPQDPWPISRQEYNCLADIFGHRIKKWYIPVKMIGGKW